MYEDLKFKTDFLACSLPDFIEANNAQIRQFIMQPLEVTTTTFKWKMT